MAGTATAQNMTAGIHAALDILILEQAKNTYFDNIVTVINNLSIPDVEDDKGNYMRGNSFVMDERADNVLIYTDVPNNALVMRCNKLSGVFYNDSFRYKEWPFVATGHCDVIINEILVQFGLGFGTTDTAEGRRLPYITGVDIDTSINRFDINIQIWGNIWSDLASLFEFIFVGTVADLIESAIVFGLQTGIPAVTNYEITRSNGYLPMPVYADWSLDWETQNKATVTDTYFGVGVKGLMFDKLTGETEPTQIIPEMPTYDTSKNQQFQAYVSSYSIDSFFSSLVEVGTIAAWFNSTMIPAGSPTQLDTSSVNNIMPGIEAYYGPNLPMDIYFDVIGAGNIGISSDQVMDGNVDLKTQWWVNLADGTRVMAAEIMLQNMNFGFTAIVADMNVTLSIDAIKTVDVIVDSCAFGTISARALKLKLNFFFTTFKVFINKWLNSF